MPRIRIVNQPITLLASEQTILDAALAADLPYPYGCRAGTCGTCKTRLLQGRVDTEPHAAEALSDAEAAAGLILACRATPRSDVVIECLGEWLEALPPVRHLQARVIALDNRRPLGHPAAPRGLRPAAVLSGRTIRRAELRRPAGTRLFDGQSAR